MDTTIIMIAAETRKRKKVESHPRAMAPAPTRAVTVPYVKNCASVDAAELERCCQKLARRHRMEEMTKKIRTTIETFLLGKGLTSLDEPSLSSSSRQPGNVASKRMEKKAKAIETNLGVGKMKTVRDWKHASGGRRMLRERRPHSSATKTTSPWNLSAASMMRSGSPTSSSDARRRAKAASESGLFEHIHSWAALTHMPM